MAYGKAAEAYKQLGYDDKAEGLSFAAVDKVVKFMDRVPPADRTLHNGRSRPTSLTTLRSGALVQGLHSELSRDDPEGYYKARPDLRLGQ